MPGGHQHRSGPLRQTNKRNKRSKSSKRSVAKQAGGKVEGRRPVFKERLLAHTKADRRHILQQRRDVKRQELLRRKRGLDGGPAPPRVIGIISLGENEVIEEQLRALILSQADKVVRTHDDDDDDTDTIISAKYEVHKKDGNLTVLTNSTAFVSQYAEEDPTDAAVMSALDLCRVCDAILFVIDGDAGKPGEDVLGMNIGGDDRSVVTTKSSSTSQDWDHLISQRGDRILAAVKGQGIPRVATVLARTETDDFGGDDFDDDHMTAQSAKSVRRANYKKKGDLKKYISRFATTEFGVDNDKVIEVSLKEKSSEDAMEDTNKVDPQEHTKKVLAAALVRTLCTINALPTKWVSQVPRAYIVAEQQRYDSTTRELHLTGFIRGAVPFDVNALVHVPNLGTFACKHVRKAAPPLSRNGGGMEDAAGLDIIESDPMKRESLNRFATPDALDGEQNLIGFDEADEEYDEDQLAEEKEGNFARPAGWSDYQSAWLDAVDGDDAQDDFDHGELAIELNKKSSATVATEANMDLDDANNISEEERRTLLEQRRKEQKEHQEFPDEVQVKEDEKARERFARYRSIKSFKKSHWDPKENLPESYSSIYHFSSFKATQRGVMADMKELARAAQTCEGRFWGRSLNAEMEPDGDAEMNASDEDDDDILEGCVPSGAYVTVTLEEVAAKDYDVLGPKALLTAVTLLPHENKVSVLHMGLTQGTNCNVSQDVPVKSKDLLTFRCGWRTWTGRPIFSQHNLNCDKHKFERFLPQCGSFFAGSVFGPVTYTPCPVLVFRNHHGRKELVATGSMIGADADRIVLKRIILTGYPVRVHKRFATVKYMFYDPEDVKWFKPAGITTKHGLNGKIEESVGEHGTMKCLFNAPIKQHDTVCLPLYKRIYPKFVDPNTKVGDDMATVRSVWKGHAITIK